MESKAHTTERTQSRASPRAPFPDFIEPCLPQLRARPPKGEKWLHEIKFDGYRVHLHLRGGDARALTRRGHDWTGRFSPIAAAVRALNAETLILDGEAIVAGADGAPDFAALHADLARGRTDRLRYYAFDLLYCDGEDVRPRPLFERREMLKALLAETGAGIVRFSDDFETAGEELFNSACAMGLEGVVSKLRDSPYRSGPSESWIKSKCVNRDNFPIVAFVEKLEARPRRIASLYLGRWQDGRLLYAGKAQSGFRDEDLYMLRERLDPYIRKTSPLSEPVKKPKATWVEPVVEAEIAYNGVTEAGVLRAPVFKALREDLSPAPLEARPARAAKRGAPAPGEKIGSVPRANILQLLPGAPAPSAEELKRY